MPISQPVRCVKRYICHCRPTTPHTRDAPVAYSVKLDKAIVKTPLCQGCGRAMTFVGGSFQELLEPTWEPPVLRQRVERMFALLVAPA